MNEIYEGISSHTQGIRDYIVDEFKSESGEIMIKFSKGFSVEKRYLNDFFKKTNKIKTYDKDEDSILGYSRDNDDELLGYKEPIKDASDILGYGSDNILENVYVNKQNTQNYETKKIANKDTDIIRNLIDNSEKIDVYLTLNINSISTTILKLLLNTFSDNDNSYEHIKSVYKQYIIDSFESTINEFVDNEFDKVENNK